MMQNRPEVRIAFHCCGYVTALIPDLIEIGIDVLEAVQAECMDIGQLKRDFGKDLSFWGAVGAQSVLAHTTPQQVRDGVVAFHEAIQRYGAYPCPGIRPG